MRVTLSHHRHIYSDDSVRRFTNVSKTAARCKAEEFIESVIVNAEKRMSDCPSAADSGLTVSDNPNRKEVISHE